MTEKSFFWGGTTVGDAVYAPYDDDEFSDFLKYIVQINSARDAVLPINLGDASLNLTRSGNTVYLASGFALVDGKLYHNDASIGFSIAVPGSGSNYYSLILRKNFAAQTVVAALLGPNTGSYPVVTQTDGVTWEILLWHIKVESTPTYFLYDNRAWIGSVISSRNPVSHPLYTNVIVGGENNEIEIEPFPDPAEINENSVIVGGDTNTINDGVTNSAIIGGNLNDVSSGVDNGVILGGHHNDLDGDNSVAMGQYADGRGEDSFVHGTLLGTAFLEVCQYARILGTLVQASHTDTTWYQLTHPIGWSGLDAVVTFEIFVNGSSGNAAQAWSYRIDATIKSVGGTLSSLYHAVTAYYESDAAYECRLNISGSSVYVEVRRNGGSDYAVRWGAVVHLLEVQVP